MVRDKELELLMDLGKVKKIERKVNTGHVPFTIQPDTLLFLFYNKQGQRSKLYECMYFPIALRASRILAY